MDERDRFYSERDRRTLEYGLPQDVFETPVSIFLGKDAASCIRGQQAILSLINMAARIHRTLALDIPPVQLLVPAIVPAMRLDDAAASLARQIDPFIRLETPHGDGVSIGLGMGVPRGLRWYVGSVRQSAVLGTAPQSFDSTNGASLGAGLAACFAASTLVRQLVGEQIRPANVSAWHCLEGTDESKEPEELGPIDVGTVMMVGAGGVGSALAYWLRHIEMRGRWIVVDGDRAQLHNTNRSLGIFPADVGWPGGDPKYKADLAAQLFGGEPAPNWYDKFDQESVKPDLVLPLANERHVRQAIAARGEPILLHATTSSEWEAQLHRHIPDRDDCIACRLPNVLDHNLFSCSSGTIATARGKITDAALPFLSASAGLLLLAGLYRLQRGELPQGSHNFWSLVFRGVRSYTRRAIHACQGGCAATVSPPARRRIHLGTRWSAVDGCSQA